MPIATIGGVAIERAGTALTWTAGLSIDADGAPDAYHPISSRGRDRLANAGEPGNWYSLVTDKAGAPVVQGPGDPRPGFYVSPTALADPTKRRTDPRRYVDSSTVPYLAVPPELRELGVRLGDLAWVERAGSSSAAVVADVGPRRHIGEGSIALARALGVPSDPRSGGCSSGVRVRVWPGSGRGWPRDMTEVAQLVEKLRTGANS